MTLAQAHVLCDALLPDEERKGRKEDDDDEDGDGEGNRPVKITSLEQLRSIEAAARARAGTPSA